MRRGEVSFRGAQWGGWSWSVDEDGALPEPVPNGRPAVLGAGQGVGECGVRKTRSVRKNAPFDRGMVEGRVWMRGNAESVVRAEAGIIACLWRF